MILISLVSEQPIPNIIVSLQLKPDYTILISTRELKHVARNVRKVIKTRGLEAFIHYRFADAYDFSSIVNLFNEITAPNVILNITGGTKIMSLAAYDSFRNRTDSVIYCDTFNKRIIFLNNNEIKNITVNLSLNEYFLAYGYEVESSSSSESVSSDAKDMFNFIEQNRLYDSFIALTKLVRENVKLYEFNKSCASTEWQYNKNSDRMNVIHLPTRTRFNLGQPGFLHGYWLEQMTYWKIYQLKESLGIDDSAYNVKLLSNHGLHNEIDVAFTKDCKLHLLSCKSGMSDENSALYELETLRHLAGGTFGHAYNVITREPSENYKKRAEELGIRIIKISELSENLFN